MLGCVCVCVCVFSCSVWSGWAWTVSVRYRGQTEMQRKREYSGDQIKDERDSCIKVDTQKTEEGNTQ